MFVYLFPSKRTRVLVVCDDEVLVVKGWMGSGRWGLPGGGLHRGEDPAEGALRELREETGIEVNATQLQSLYSKRNISEHGFRYSVHAYVLELKKKPKLTKQRLEITHLAWIRWQELHEDPKTDKTIKHMLTAFYKRSAPL